MGALQGMGWCAYADISLALRRLRAASQGALTNFMIVDLDAHQGNGVARVRQHYADDGCFIVDVYNARVFPRDTAAKQVRACVCVCAPRKAGAAEVRKGSRRCCCCLVAGYRRAAGAGCRHGGRRELGNGAGRPEGGL